ncbi:DNRLRE domain-containing protein [Streptomyces sp. NPDC059816]|uniref:DNRLRE domain-containing protein n=1 Tax=Streptomyces sp. NPDC059816 TaxID=3346960 RepID=UPI003658852B
MTRTTRTPGAWLRPRDRRGTPAGRAPGRRTTAAVLAAVVVAGGLAYAGLRPDGSAPDRDDPGSAARKPAAGPVTESAAAAEAARTGRKVEATALRTATSSTWVRPDGLMATRFHSAPVYAKSGGEWRPIDLDLRRTARGWEPTVSNTRLVFSAGSSTAGGQRKESADRASRSAPRGPLRTTVREQGGSVRQEGRAQPPANATVFHPLATMHVGTHTIDLTWPGTVPVPVIEGNRALYPEILPGADLVMTADDSGFAPVLVLKDRQAAAHPLVQQLAYGLDSSTLSFHLDPLSGMVSAVDADGEEAALSPTPLIWDSSGEPAVTDGQVGATAQPTEPETPGAPDPVPTAPTDSPSPTELPLESDEQTDPEGEVLPTATDGLQTEPEEPPLPTAPAEPTPEPSRTGTTATLGLSSLNGPSPDSRGELIESDLNDSSWSLTPDQEFLADPATTYPVFVDPAFTKPTASWTTVYDRYPNATFYEGKGFNKGGTHEARVGYESDTWGTSRSFFNIDLGDRLDGVQIKKATLYTLSTYAWSCSPRSMSIHLTSKINKRTNWRNAPKLHDGNKQVTRSFAHGYKTMCPDAHVKFSLRDAVQKRVDQGQSTVTFGMRARDERSEYGWKKFRAIGETAPKLEIVYNRRPDAPTNLDLGPEAKCTTTTPYVRVGADAVTLTARASDKDGNLDYFDFDLWQTGKWDSGGDRLGAVGKVDVGGDRSAALRTTSAFSINNFASGTVFSWRVRAVDDAKSTSSYSPAATPCRFVYDKNAPKPPRVSSVDFPNADGSENGFGNDAEDSNWSKKKFGTPGSFTVRALDSDVVRYEYGFNSESYTGSVSRTAGSSTSGSATISNAKPPAAGPNVLYVRVVDQAGNVSQPTKYFFYVTPRDQADKAGDFTGDGLPDLLVVTSGGNLALYPSQGKSDEVTKGTGDLDYSMAGAYQTNKDKDPNGDDKPLHLPAASGHFKGSLITHNGDVYGGDGLQDLIVRVGGKLWVYPGDGYGAVNIDRRREILLPEGAPAPSTFTQVLSAGDVTGDGRADLFVTVGDALWILAGYQGATVDQAIRLTSAPWAERDLVSGYDVSGDGVADLVYRVDPGKLVLRKGKPAAGGGVDLSSLAAAANSAGGADTTYGASGWSVAGTPFAVGTPDADGDGIPDIWSVRSDGSVRFHPGSRTALSGDGGLMIGPNSHWKTRLAVG